MLEQANKSWHGVKLNQPDWGDNSHSVALFANLKNDGLMFYIILNAYWESLDFELPILPSGTWQRWIDTSLDSPNDISVVGRMHRQSQATVIESQTGPW